MCNFSRSYARGFLVCGLRSYDFGACGVRQQRTTPTTPSLYASGATSGSTQHREKPTRDAHACMPDIVLEHRTPHKQQYIEPPPPPQAYYAIEHNIPTRRSRPRRRNRHHTSSLLASVAAVSCLSLLCFVVVVVVVVVSCGLPYGGCNSKLAGWLAGWLTGIVSPSLRVYYTRIVFVYMHMQFIYVCYAIPCCVYTFVKRLVWWCSQVH